MSIWHGIGRTVSDSFGDIPPVPLPYKLKLHVSNNSAWRSSENKKSVTILRIWNFPLAANQSFKTQVSKSAKAILAKLQTSSVGESSWAKERINPNILQYNAPGGLKLFGQCPYRTNIFQKVASLIPPPPFQEFFCEKSGGFLEPSSPFTRKFAK